MLPGSRDAAATSAFRRPRVPPLWGPAPRMLSLAHWPRSSGLHPLRSSGLHPLPAPRVGYGRWNRWREELQTCCQSFIAERASGNRIYRGRLAQFNLCISSLVA
ncbi:hypothetical protein NN561_006951 [Cricetulus griseus]